MVAFADKPVHTFDTIEEFERFLEADPPDGGIRVRLRKKGSTQPGMTWAEAVDVALCFGWIDGQAGRHPEDPKNFTLQAFTPRRRNSPWSQINVGNVARLTETGRMRPGGLAEVARAQADGRWDAAYRQKDAPVPDDLQAALDANPAAAAAFAGLNSQNRFAILFRVSQAKRAETRARRIAEFTTMLAEGRTLHPR
ncbi:YdeI family protein [Kineococcus gynurae]|uniref:YdeI family protein n=1 Tax=Kineococcus gynurae TaxID=452979 RepID=A0ABV5LTY2_9ACTN